MRNLRANRLSTHIPTVPSNYVVSLAIMVLGALLACVVAYFDLIKGMYLAIYAVGLSFVVLRYGLLIGLFLGSVFAVGVPFQVNLSEMQFIADFYSPYVNGVLSQYRLIRFDLSYFMLHLLVIYLISVFRVLPNWKVLLTAGLLFLLHNIYFHDLVVLLSSYRLVFVLLSFYVFIKFLRERIEFINLSRETSYVGLVVLLILICANLYVSLEQVMDGGSTYAGLLAGASPVPGMPGVAVRDIYGALYLRAYGLFLHPNIMAAFYTGVYLVSLIYQERSRLFWFVTQILVLLGVVLTMSRTAISIVIILVLLSISRRYLIAILPDSFDISQISRKWRLFSNAFIPVAVVERYELFVSGFKMLIDHPLTGVGAGLSIFVSFDYAVRGDAGRYIYEPLHNIPLMMLVEYGLIVGIVIIFAVLGLYTMLWNHSTNTIKLFSILYGAWVLIISFSDHFFITLSQGVGVLFFPLLLMCWLGMTTLDQKLKS